MGFKYTLKKIYMKKAQDKGFKGTWLLSLVGQRRAPFFDVA